MKRYKYYIIMLLFFLFVSIASVNAIINSYSLSGKTICLDAGHGGRDSGALFNNILEKDINLVIVKKMESILLSRGAFVYLTREGDYDLSTTNVNKKRSDLRNRANIINKSDCDMFISIHLNFISDSRWRGLQIFYNNRNKENMFLAKSITEYLKNNMDNVRDYKNASNYYLYRLIEKPGVLIELGFLSNPDDRYLLTKEKYQDKLVTDLVNSIEYVYRNKNKK